MTDSIPEVVPGQEGGNHWENAWDLANLRNHGIREDCKHPHFYVVPFLKSKTGLDMPHLARLTKSRDEKLKSERELVEVDRELAHALIDVEYLLREANKRISGAVGGCHVPYEGGGGCGGDAVDSENLEMDLMMEIASRLVAKKRAGVRKQGGGTGPANGTNARDTNLGGVAGTVDGEGCGVGSAAACVGVAAGGVRGVRTSAEAVGGGGGAGGSGADTCNGSDASPRSHDALALSGGATGQERSKSSE